MRALPQAEESKLIYRREQRHLELAWQQDPAQGGGWRGVPGEGANAMGGFKSIAAEGMLPKGG